MEDLIAMIVEDIVMDIEAGCVKRPAGWAEARAAFADYVTRYTNDFGRWQDSGGGATVHLAGREFANRAAAEEEVLGGVLAALQCAGVIA